jgi:hypothetical protein
LLWALALLFLSDLAMPLSPGVFSPFEPGQNLEMARRASIQLAAAQLPPFPHRFPTSVRPAPFPTVGNAEALRREATSPRTFAPLARSPQHEVEALNSADPA